MAIVEIFAGISVIGFLVAAGFAFKSYFATKEATNVWLLFAIGFALLAAKNFFVFTIILNNQLGYLDEFLRDLELVGVALIFASMAVYYKEKRICLCFRNKKCDAKTMKSINRFSDGV